MRFRIYFKDYKQEPVEIDCIDLRVFGSRRLKAYLKAPIHNEDCVDIFFGDDIRRIADDHDRTFFEA